MTSSFVLCTHYDSGMTAMGDMSAATLRDWAARHGHRAEIRAEPAVPGRPPAWTKIRLMADILDSGAEGVMWVDADCLVVDPTPDPLAALGEAPEADLRIAYHHYYVRPQPGILVRFEMPNTGVVILRNSSWSRAFLQRVWDNTAWLEHEWWENAAVMDLMGYHTLLDSGRANTPDPTVMARIAWLDLSWNARPDMDPSPRPVINHYTRTMGERRRDWMREDFEKLRLGTE